MIKQLELKLNKRLLIVESENANEFFIMKNIPAGTYYMICKGSDLTEDIAKEFQIENLRIAHNGEYLSAIEEFKFHIRNKGYHWGYNPVKKPKKEEYGYSYANAFDEQSGWMYEGGEDKYYEALGQFELERSRTFNPEKCIICEILKP